MEDKQISGENIWEAMLDKRYLCDVSRKSERVGILNIFDTYHREIIYSQKVPLSYGAAFGPDFQDVADWEEICLNEVDKLNE